MAETTRVISNLNDTLPAAPAGHDNVKWQINRGVTPPNISANVPRADVAGTKYGTIIYDGSDSPTRYLGADGEWHNVPTGGAASGRATFLVGLGAASVAADNVAPPYRVKVAGTISEVRAKARAGITGDVSFMLRRIRNTSPATDDDILSAELTIGSGSVAWVSTTSFAVDDLEIDDELELDITEGSPRDATLELYWS